MLETTRSIYLNGTSKTGNKILANFNSSLSENGTMTVNETINDSNNLDVIDSDFNKFRELAKAELKKLNESEVVEPDKDTETDKDTESDKDIETNENTEDSENTKAPDKKGEDTTVELDKDNDKSGVETDLNTESKTPDETTTSKRSEQIDNSKEVDTSTSEDGEDLNE